MLKNGLVKKISSIRHSAQNAAKEILGDARQEDDESAGDEGSDSGSLDNVAVTSSPGTGPAESGRARRWLAKGPQPQPAAQSPPVVSVTRVAMSLQERVSRFKELLAAETIDIQQLRLMARDGIPDKDNLRALTWKLLLQYLPVDSSKWMSHLMKKRAEYQQFRKELIVKPGSASSHTVETLEGQLTGVNVSDDDHPLSLGSTSVWNTYFKDVEVVEQIERDVKRTHPDIHFFSGDNTESVRHREEMQRALFVYAKLNPGLTYVQGMNELFAPLYHAFSLDANAEHAEADAFWCFVELMTEFRDNYCEQLDNSDQGIKANLARFSRMVKNLDPELHDHLENKVKVDTHFYAFRWITLLLTQEYSFPDTVRLWDTILSFPHGRAEFLMKVCCAMLILVRDELLAGDFTHNIKLLQRYPRTTDVGEVLSVAQSLDC